MTKPAILIFIFICSGFLTGSETYLKFAIHSKKELRHLTKVVSIDKVSEWEVYAYADDKQLVELESLGYKVEILPHPGTLIDPQMATNRRAMLDWDSYPTYETYRTMMYQYATNYPDLCTVMNIGNSVEDREILIVKISDNVNINENEPEFLYSSTMHGDEVAGYVLMLRLIDYLLSNYGTDPRVTNLVENVEIWINPLANPDGTYHSGNYTIWGAIRYNANGVDLNRNFPDPDDGDHPDGYPYQPETIAMMNLADEHNFVLSSNMHAGAEVVNYPWDTWPQLHADDDWWREVCHTYADAAQENSPYWYMNGFNDGITNGYDWYPIFGGRQDFMIYFHGGREMTLELSDVKLLPESELLAHWDYNRESFLLYMEECLYGIRGIVTDNNSNPLDATITVLQHDFDNSEVFTDPEVGDFHRMIAPGAYDLIVSSYGYISQMINNVTVTDNNITIVDVVLEQAETITITGLVTNGYTGIPIGNATIELLDTPVSPVVTDENGEYTIPSVMEDIYMFRVSKEGYAGISELISVTAENSVISFELYESIAESFESGNFGLDWNFSGNADWTIVNSGVYDGSYCAKSGNISHDQISTMFINLDISNPGDISFFKKVSSENDYDFLEFYLDSIKLGSWSGEISWSEENYPVSSGNHTFKWIYSKDGSVSYGSDCAWVDYIVFPPLGMPVEEIIVFHSPGWNLVGLPMIVNNPGYSTVFPNATGGTLYSFDNSYTQESTLVPGTGYWLHFQNAGSSIISGGIIDVVTIHLTEGWNLISGITMTVDINNIDDPGGLIIPNTIYQYTEGYVLANTIEPGGGYWINAAADGDIIISSGIITGKTGSGIVNRLEGANKLTFNGQTLYFGVRIPEEEKLSYSLPPKPPLGSFDIRFAGNWKFCEEYGEVEVMNNTELLTISYNVKDGKSWMLSAVGGENYNLTGSGEIGYSGDTEKFTLIKNIKANLPHLFKLYQNYPNPFNPMTTISFELPEQSTVSLIIYDISGRKIKELIKDEIVNGLYNVVWNATDDSEKPVSAGVYLYRLKAGNLVKTKKLILMK